MVGVSFHPDYPESLHRLEHGGPRREGSLIRERDNEHDPNAIAVLIEGSVVGHLPRLVAARYAPEIDSGARYRVTDYAVQVNWEHPDRPGLDIEAVLV